MCPSTQIYAMSLVNNNVIQWEAVSTILKYDMEKGKEHHSPFKIKNFHTTTLNPAYGITNIA